MTNTNTEEFARNSGYTKKSEIDRAVRVEKAVAAATKVMERILGRTGVPFVIIANPLPIKPEKSASDSTAIVVSDSNVNDDGVRRLCAMGIAKGHKMPPPDYPMN